MAPSSNGQDTRFSSLQYGFDSRWCFQISGCRLSLVEGSAWNGEVIGSNPITLRLLNSTPPRGKSWITLRCYTWIAIKCECKLLSRTSKLSRVKRTGRSLSTKSSRRTHYRIACKNFGYNLLGSQEAACNTFYLIF